MTALRIICMLGLLSLAACAPMSRPQVATPTPRAPEEVASPVTSETPTVAEELRKELAARAVVVYQRSGGFAGISEQWAILPDGRVINQDGRQWRIPKEQVAELVSAIEEMGFFKMRDSYGALDVCCDRFVHRITVRSGGRVKTVTTVDAASGAPTALWHILERIQRLVFGLQ